MVSDGQTVHFWPHSVVHNRKAVHLTYLKLFWPPLKRQNFCDACRQICYSYPISCLKEIRLSISCKKCILMESSWPRMTPQSKERKAPWCSQIWCRVQCNAQHNAVQWEQCNTMRTVQWWRSTVEHRVYSGEGAMQYNVNNSIQGKTMQNSVI